MSQRLRDGTVRISAENVGGIDETTITLDPGVTVLAGRNATNRTSFLQAVMAGLGSDRVSLKGDAESGRVELVTPTETYTRTLERGHDGIRFGGDPLLDDPEVADLFAFLLEDNPARRAVERDDDLWELVMRPVDTEEIEAEIRTLEATKEELDRQLDELAQVEERLPELEQRRNDLDAEIAETEAELDRVHEELDATAAEPDDETTDELLAALNEARSELADVRFGLETERESVASLEAEREELRAELGELPETPASDLDTLETELETLRERKRRLDSVTSTLQNLLQFNREMLDGTHADLFDRLADDDETVTDGLLGQQEAVCWTCGSSVERDDFEGMVDRLQSAYQDARAERATVSSDLDDVQAEKRERERQRERRESLREGIETIEAELADRRGRITDLDTRRGDLEDRVRDLDERVADRRESDEQAVVELHERANDLEFELGRLAEQRADLVADIEALETDIERKPALHERREQVANDLETQRTRIDRLEADVVESFNDHMDELLALLDYENVDRIWIERKRDPTTRDSDGARSTFDLHVVRSDASGASYEDAIAHLSESEREVTGLTFALAGYLAHEVYEEVPVVLLDSLEAVDSARIATLVEYFESYADYLVVALLHEDAAAVADDYPRVTDI
ncbi:archaea-specific SMC-related protein [Haloarchaeobius sp. DFWS5]|uniref:archaea-specific SMC-related protein n=1 Tax=Haloarchaeobius sp. DFWS5 TaxID=3446114 RepID=UPI003EC09129